LRVALLRRPKALALPHVAKFAAQGRRVFGWDRSGGFSFRIGANDLADTREVQTLYVAQVLDAFENLE
jgi:hypothetical protein